MSNFQAEAINQINQITDPKMQSYLFHIYTNLSLDINLNYMCSLSCVGCNRILYKRQNPEYNISIDKIIKCLEDIEKNNVHLQHIGLSGGEPTLHPDIMQICSKVIKLKSKNCKVQLVTNGYSQKTKNIIPKIESMGIKIYNSQKSNTKEDIKGFHSHTVTPNEVHQLSNETLLCCEKPDECGFLLNHRGFYICHFSATVEDYFNLRIEKKRYTDLTPTEFIREMKIVCKHCGNVCNPKLPVDYLGKLWERKIRKKKR